MAKLDVIEVDNDLFWPFKWRDDTPGGRNLGRAEFTVCLRYYRGVLREWWVTPDQQHDIDRCWHVPAHGRRYLTINSYEKLADPKVWMVGYCTEHRGPFLRLYVPDGACYLRLAFDGISFTKTDWGA